jgi:hypothetical protein
VAEPQTYGAPRSEDAVDDAAETTQIAVEQGQEVAGEAADQARAVAGTAAEQASQVAGEVSTQVHGLVTDAKHQLHDQARQQTEQLGGVLGQLGERVEALASGRPEDAGPLGDYAGSIADQVQQIAGRVGELGFDGVVDEVQSFARRRPGAFLAAAAVAGFAASRLARGAQAAADHAGGSGQGDASASVGSLATPAPAPSTTAQPGARREAPLFGDVDLTDEVAPPPVPATATRPGMTQQPVQIPPPATTHPEHLTYGQDER